MATITFNIPDAQLPRVINAVCAEDGWDSSMKNPDGSSMTKSQFTKLRGINFYYDKVKTYEARQAVQNLDVPNVEKSARDKVQTEVSIS